MDRDKDTVLQSERFSNRCRHNKFKVDQSLATVKCGICGESLNPMWVLGQLCDKEARAWNHLEILNGLIEKSKNKLRCKCEHCKKMTRIQK